MAKPANLLNNLLRRLREVHFRKFSIAEAATAIDIPASYLTKVENGDTEKPNEEYLKKLLDVYGRDANWEKLIKAIWQAIDDMTLFGDQPLTSANDAIESLISQGPSVSIYGTLLPGPVKSVIQQTRPGNRNQVCYAADALVSRIANHPEEEDDFKEFFDVIEAEPAHSVATSAHLVPLSMGHDRVVLLNEVLLAYPFGRGWVLTADDQTLKTWRESYRKLIKVRGRDLGPWLESYINENMLSLARSASIVNRWQLPKVGEKVAHAEP